MKTNNQVTDLDTIELSSSWNYNNQLPVGQKIRVNKSVYKVTKKREPTNTGLGYKVYERYDNKGATGDIVISFDGSDFSDMNDIKTDLHLSLIHI